MPDPLAIDVSFLCRDWLEKMPDVEDRCHLAAQAAFDAAFDNAAPEFPGGAEVSIVLADDDQVRRLNRDYRGIDTATNVLSFANVDDDGAQTPHPDGSGPVLLGDVVIAYGVAVAEAGTEGKSLADHLAHLVVHGMLHLLGYDHMEDEEAETMERLERDVLEALGVGDPYDEPAPETGIRQSAAAMP